MGQKYAIFDQEGLPKAFYDDEIHSNIPQEAIPIAEAQWKELVENPGRRKWNFQTNQVEVYTPPPPTLQELKQQKQAGLSQFEKQRVEQILDEYGYLSLADVQYWHQQDPKDPEPKKLLDWYKAYDDAIWNEIDNLQNKTYEELKDYDPKIVEQEIFEQTKEELPPLED